MNDTTKVLNPIIIYKKNLTFKFFLYIAFLFEKAIGFKILTTSKIPLEFAKSFKLIRNVLWDQLNLKIP